MAIVFSAESLTHETELPEIQPDWHLTVSETPDGPVVRPYSESDLKTRDLDISVFKDTATGARYLTQELVGTLVYELNRNTMQGVESPVAVILAADTTHDTGNPGFYGLFGPYADALGFDKSRLRVMQLDNYWYPLDRYPERTDAYDFAGILERKFILPNGIDSQFFYPIKSIGTDPDEVVRQYEQLFQTLKPVAGTFGIGPLPECHLGYIPQGTPLKTRFGFVQVSPATTARNIERGQHTPDTAITIGPANISQLKWKFVTSWKNPEVTDSVFLGPITTDVVATMLRRTEYRHGVRVFLNQESAQPLLDRLI